MKPLAFPYPPTPDPIRTDITTASPAFKKQVGVVLGSIVLFFIVYIILFLLAIGLVAGCVAGGFFLIGSFRSIYGILFGLGLIAVGLLVLFFLVKFLFSVSRYDRSRIVEVTETQHPALFAFVRQLAEETQTKFPKRIYLSSDVNACVFYDSSFWSMFFPVRKNLQIGLGLVNTINISEFKAVVAHEFGHFSQSSMKLGSFVYQVNRIIYNMLFENNSYSNILSGFARIADVFALFANITVKIIQGIQWVLKQMYGVVNKNYMGLSREMEFHADAVAASVTGGNNLVSALQRLEFGEMSYSITIGKYNELWKEKKKAVNIYDDQLVVLNRISGEMKLQTENGLPVVTEEADQNSHFRRVNFKDQWASHPATTERKKHLENLGVTVAADQRSPWVLFSEVKSLQEEMTHKLYQDIPDEPAVVLLQTGEFKEYYNQFVQQYTLPEAYNHFYDGREYSAINVDELSLHPYPQHISWEAVFNNENGTLIKRIQGIAEDMQVLESISRGDIDTKTFDFDGQKYEKSEAHQLKAELETEKQRAESKLFELDKNAFVYFYQQAFAQSPETARDLKERYAAYFSLKKQLSVLENHVNAMMGNMQPIYAGETIPVESIDVMIGTLKKDTEPELKKQLNEWMAKGVYEKHAALRERVQQFVQANYVYFTGSTFFNNELTDLYEISRESWEVIHDFIFTKFKEILEYQLTIKR